MPREVIEMFCVFRSLAILDRTKRSWWENNAAELVKRRDETMEARNDAEQNRDESNIDINILPQQFHKQIWLSQIILLNEK